MKLYLVAQAPEYGNLLAYNPKTSEYIYYHNGKKIWSQIDSIDLLNYCSDTQLWDYDKLQSYAVWKRYSADCDLKKREDFHL